MKHIIAGIAACAALTMLQACSEDFDVAAPYKEITVGYGLLNMSDTAHYIRIQKAFLDETKSAVDMARTGDSSYYQSLDVRVREINPQGRVVHEAELSRVNLDAEGYPKQPGAFFTVPNYAYKYKRELTAGYTYRLVIRHTGSGITDSAETVVLSDNRVEDPSDFTVFQFRQSIYDLVFQNQGYPNGKFSLLVTGPANGKLYQGIIRFHWVDVNTSSREQTDRYADWSFYLQESATGYFEMNASYIDFYAFLASAMKAAPANTERYMDSSDIFIWAGSQELAAYRQLEMISGGLTGDQIRPRYTNFKGSGSALGLFGSRAAKSRTEIPFQPATLDSLKIHPVTRDLNIRGLSDH